MMLVVRWCVLVLCCLIVLADCNGYNNPNQPKATPTSGGGYSYIHHLDQQKPLVPIKPGMVEGVEVGVPRVTPAYW